MAMNYHQLFQALEHMLTAINQVAATAPSGVPAAAGAVAKATVIINDLKEGLVVADPIVSEMTGQDEAPAEDAPAPEPKPAD